MDEHHAGRRDGHHPSDHPPLRLNKPRSRTLLTSALIVLAISTLSTCIFAPDQLPFVGGDGAPDAGSSSADEVVRILREMEALGASGGAPVVLADAMPGALPTSLNGVGFRLELAADWRASHAERQILLRKQDDPRICQITASDTFDHAGFLAETKGKEAAFEDAMMTEMMSVAVPDAATIEVASKVLDSVGKDAQYRYVVRGTASMRMGTASATQGLVSATAIDGPKMVRLQCANTRGEGDPGRAMETMARSLRLAAQ